MSLGRLPFLRANSSTVSMWANPRCMYLRGQDRITGLQRFGKTLATSKSMMFQPSTSLPTIARPRKSPATPWTANAWPLPSRVSISWGIATAPSRKKPSTNYFLPAGPLGKGTQAARSCWVGLLQTSLLTLPPNRPLPTPLSPSSMASTTNGRLSALKGSAYCPSLKGSVTTPHWLPSAAYLVCHPCKFTSKFSYPHAFPRLLRLH